MILSFLEKRQHQMSGHAPEGNPRGSFDIIQKRNGVRVGPTSQLQRARGGDRAHQPPEPNGCMRRATSHITTHRPAIELPERPEPVPLQAVVPFPEHSTQVGGVEAMPLESTTDRQATQGNGGCSESRDNGLEGLRSILSRVDLDGIGTEFGQKINPVLAFLDQSKRTGRAAATAAVATVGIDHAG